jgi:tyrosyl-tRNA synthetase
VLTTPILEGLDGVQKMSKSLGNAIGIHEPPLEMYGKIMSISDEMMWRYYELLTDVQMVDIEKAKQEVHPMLAKKELARRIVADFHSTEAAAKAGEDWAKQFQKDGVPEEVETVSVAYSEVAPAGLDGIGHVTGNGLEGIGPTNPARVKLDKLLVRCGLAESASDGSRKIKQGAVRIDGQVRTDPVLTVTIPVELTIRVGKSICKAAIS